MSDLKKLERALEKARTSRERHAAYEDLAEYYYTRQEFENALNCYEHELQAAVDLSDDFKVAKAHRMIGEVKCELALYDEALKHQKKYYEYACAGLEERLPEQQRALTTLGRTWFLMGESLRDQENYDDSQKAHSQARDLLLKSLLVCEKLEKRSHISKTEVNDMKARSLLNLGLVYEGQGDTNKAIKEMDLAVRVSKANYLQSTQRLCSFSLGCVHLRSDDIPKALLMFKEALLVAKSLPNEERAQALCEIYMSQSDAHLKLGDIHSARKDLQKAYFLNTPVSEGKEAIAQKLKSVAAMDIAHSRLVESTGLSYEEKAELYEKLGDGFSSKGVYLHALNYYKKMLESSKMADLNLKACLVSLAQTSKDLKRYDDAIQYFEQEIALSSPSEGVLSLLAIADCQEKAGLSVADQMATYDRALKLAEEANNIKLQHRVLVEMEQVQSSAGLPQADKTRCEIKKLAASLPDTESSDDEEENTPDISADIDLGALSECSSIGDEEEFDRQGNTSKGTEVRLRRNPQRQREAIRWRNEKGETKLHVACISGKLSAVRTLLDQGCDVNAMDNAGWTPLHEACNNGHSEIVELLLKSGANINHKGGPLAGGITPLHDAASAGNFIIMNLLLDHNASATLLTDEGHNALDTLVEFYKRGGHLLTAEETQEYNHIVDRLNGILDKVGQARRDVLMLHSNKSKISPQSRNNRCGRSSSICEEVSPKLGKDKISPKTNVGRLRKAIDDSDLDDCLTRKRRMREMSPVHSDHESPSSSPIQVYSDEDEHESVTQYQQVMKDLRKNSSKNSVIEKSSDWQRKPLQPLLSENEVVTDWLEDDMGPQPTKKRKTSNLKELTSTYTSLPVMKKKTSRLSLGCTSSDQTSGGARGPSPSSHESREETRLSFGVSEMAPTPDRIEDINMDNLWMEDTVLNDFRSDTLLAASENSWGINSSPVTPARRQSSLLSLGITRKRPSAELPLQPASTFSQQPTSQIPVSQPPVQNRINVRIENRLLALPVPAATLPIGWLAEEAAKRFYKVEGVLPVLTLQAADGALLANDDPVSLLLGGDEIVGCVQSWNVPPITERYKEACCFFTVEVDNGLMRCLEASQATQALEIVNCILPAPLLKPVFRAIAMEHSLLKLSLANNWMKDEGLKDLCEQLGRLVNLRELDVSGNGITAQGMTYLVKTASNGNLKTLCDLNLSHNDLRDGCVSSLSTLTSFLPSLSGLAMANCGFTRYMWDGHNHLLTLANLLSLDLSANQLYAKGLAGFLGFSDHNENRRLSPDRVKTFHLIGVGGSLLCQELLLFLERAERIALQEIHLSYSTMQDDDIMQLLRVLKTAPYLHTIRIPSAPNLTALSVSHLLQLKPQLRHLEVLGKRDMWRKVDTEALQELVETAAQHLETLSLKNPPELVEDTFRKVWGSNTCVKRGACGLFLLRVEGG